MANDAVTAAIFTGDVTFEETGLRGCAARVDYQPQKESLALSGATKAGNPIVAEEQVAIDAGGTIEVGLETREMKARGGVTLNRLAPMQRCRPARTRPASEQGASNLPKLLKTDALMTITAPSLDYDSRKGYAFFTGGKASLTQEKTSIAGDSLVIDQTKGNLTATGNVRSTLMLDDKVNKGTAHEISYVDDKRLITYASAPKAGSGVGEVSLIAGPDSTIRAGSIDLTLAAKENTLERMRAAKNVRLTEGAQSVEKGATLDYTAADDQYVVKGDGTTQVVVTMRDTCRQQFGQSITFFKGAGNVSVTGGNQSGSTAPLKADCTPSTRK